MDRLVRFYRRLSTTARSVIVFVLAVSVALATMHALTFSATAITKKTGEEDPGIVLNQDPENEDFDNVSEGTGTDNPEEKPSEPAETPAAPEVQEGEPSPEPSAMPEEPGTEPEVTAAPEETGAPEETEAPEEVIIAEEEQSGAELLSEEPEEESDPTADRILKPLQTGRNCSVTLNLPVSGRMTCLRLRKARSATVKARQTSSVMKRISSAATQDTARGQVIPMQSGIRCSSCLICSMREFR